MKIKTAMKSALVISTIAVVNNSIAAGFLERGYVNASAGVTDHQGASQLRDEMDSDLVGSFDGKGTGFQLSSGVALNDSVSIELFYVDYGDFEYRESREGTPEYFEIVGSTSGVGASLRYEIPIVPDVNAYGRLGLLKWSTELEMREVSDAEGDLIQESESTDIDSFDPFMAFGVGYQILPGIQVFGELNYSNAQYQTLNNSVCGVFFGIGYVFGDVSRRTEAKLPTSASTPSTNQGGSNEYSGGGSRSGSTACDPKYKDISGVMCQ